MDFELKLVSVARPRLIFFNISRMEECPVCLENLSGTLVHMGCCKKMVHIQCYTLKCPMCRADLPAPIHATEPQHIIIPVPIAYTPRDNGKTVRSIIGFIGFIGVIAIVMSPYYN